MINSSKNQNSNQQRTILVAEDDAFQLQALCQLLEMCNYNSIPAENGKIAMDHLNDDENDFDLVLVDLNMPVMGGLEVLSQMRNDSRLCKLPVAVMSASESNDVIADCLRLGADNFLVKPVRISECKLLNGFMRKKIGGTYASKYIELQSSNQLKKLEVIRDIDSSPSGILRLV
jgi:CheY-like chemotaxis protein